MWSKGIHILVSKNSSLTEEMHPTGASSQGKAIISATLLRGLKTLSMVFKELPNHTLRIKGSKLSLIKEIILEEAIIIWLTG